jgi:hypothetical protein
MEQRPLRLGDIVDDYCPRERRVTNHVIVAIVGDAIRQTRCQTCDSDHVYKEARVPRRKKKDETAALYDQVLADASGGQLVHPRAASEEAPPAPAGDPPAPGAQASAADRQSNAPPVERQDEAPAEDENGGHLEMWSAHRPLIRATLPRTEGEPPPVRPIPEFTMHQRPPHRGGHGFRHGQSWQGGNGQPPRHGGGGRQGRPGGDFGNSQPGPGGRRSGRHRGGKNRRPR